MGGSATDSTGAIVTGKPTIKPGQTTGDKGGTLTTSATGSKGTTTTEKPKGPRPEPTKPSTEVLMKAEKEAKAKTKEMMKDPSKIKPDQAKMIAASVGLISSDTLDKMPAAVKVAVSQLQNCLNISWYQSHYRYHLKTSAITRVPLCLSFTDRQVFVLSRMLLVLTFGEVISSQCDRPSNTNQA
jgi:hypothetical protein